MPKEGQRKQKYAYERRRPELSPCHKIIQSAWESFKEDRQLEQRPLPQYVNNEFEAFLRCGIFAYGFLRLKCEACGEEKITAFSCKQRGFCPS
ncbi:MAG: IS91 family transposase, partial [Acidimicrobiaceae bacterium]|nr:IS91 family transposase [Acidimicrobiaceae bacterium]